MEKVKAAGQRRYRESLDELIDELRDELDDLLKNPDNRSEESRRRAVVVALEDALFQARTDAEDQLDYLGILLHGLEKQAHDGESVDDFARRTRHAIAQWEQQDEVDADTAGVARVEGAGMRNNGKLVNWAPFKKVDCHKEAHLRARRAKIRYMAYRAQGDERRAARAWDQVLRWDAASIALKSTGEFEANAQSALEWLREDSEALRQSKELPS